MSTILCCNHGTDCYKIAATSSGLLQVITGQHPIAIGRHIYRGLLPRYQCYKVYMALLTTLPFSWCDEKMVTFWLSQGNPHLANASKAIVINITIFKPKLTISRSVWTDSCSQIPPTIWTLDWISVQFSKGQVWTWVWDQTVASLPSICLLVSACCLPPLPPLLIFS